MALVQKTSSGNISTTFPTRPRSELTRLKFKCTRNLIKEGVKPCQNEKGQKFVTTLDDTSQFVQVQYKLNFQDFKRDISN